MKRLPKFLAAVALGTGCTPVPSVPGNDGGKDDAGSTTDAGLDAGYDAGPEEPVTCPPAAPPHDAGVGTPYGDAGCVLPSDFPWDAGSADLLAEEACTCVFVSSQHCFEENGPRCFSWACPPAKTQDGGYECFSDGGLVCLC